MGGIAVAVANTVAMQTVELERTLVKSPPEIWDVLASGEALSRRLGRVRLGAADPPRRLEWESDVAQGVIELNASGWGTKVRAVADTDGPPGDRPVEQCLEELLDDLGASSLTSG